MVGWGCEVRGGRVGGNRGRVGGKRGKGGG